MSKPTKVVQKCKSCGGDLVFNPSKNGLACQRCGSFESVNGAFTTEKSLQELLDKAPTWQKDTIIVQCEHCGAKSVVSKFDLVAKCDYCGTANMVKTAETPGLRPDTIVLFEINRADALKQVNTWLSKRFFVPLGFKQQLKDRQINGIYFPVFTFDANVTAKYTATLVQTNTTTIMIEGKETTQSQTIRRPIRDVITHVFDDYLILANDETINAKTLGRLQPFDTNHGQVFQQSYLSGFTVAQSSKDPHECWAEAKTAMEQAIRNQITARYTGNLSVENLRLDLDFSNITYKYALLPVYVGHIEYKGTQYPLYLNGQTGKIYGKTPKSWWKMLLTFTAMGLAAFGVGIILAMFL